MYGNSMQSLLPQYLETSMSQFCANQEKLREAFAESISANPLAKLAQQNLAVFQAAASAFMPGEAPAAKPEAPQAATPASDLDTLRAQMAEMQKRLDAMGN